MHYDLLLRDVKIAKTGPKEQTLGKNADYQITVTNEGDLPLTNVIVSDSAANSTSIVSANGATVRGNQAVWKLKELKAGEKVTFGITLTTCTPGCVTNRATVNTYEGVNGCADKQPVGKGALPCMSASAIQKTRSASMIRQAIISN